MPDVLIVDASKLCRELLVRVLEGQGFSTASASPEEALSVIEQSPPALVLLEPGLADSAGWLVLEQLCNRYRSGQGPAIVVLTDQTGKPEILRAAQAGVRDYLLKEHFFFAEFLTRVRRHVAPNEHLAARRSSPAAQKQSASASTSAADTPTANSPAASRSSPSTNSQPGDGQPLRDLREMASEMGLKVRTKESTLEKLDAAPVKTLPGVVAEVISLVNSPRGSIEDLAQILRRDPVLAARVLRVANSAAFSSQRQGRHRGRCGENGRRCGSQEPGRECRRVRRVRVRRRRWAAGHAGLATLPRGLDADGEVDACG